MQNSIDESLPLMNWQVLHLRVAKLRDVVLELWTTLVRPLLLLLVSMLLLRLVLLLSFVSGESARSAPSDFLSNASLLAP